jgi:hypothetical protein
VSETNDIISFEKGLKKDGSTGFDVLTVGDVAKASVNLSGTALKGFEAVVANGSGREHVTVALRELMAESGQDGKAAFAAVLGEQPGDKISLSGSGWKFVAEVNSGHETPLARSLGQSELSQLSQAHAGSNSSDLKGFLLQKGTETVTVWTDLDSSAVYLNGTAIDHT